MSNKTPSLREAAALWARVGCLSFGGAAGQIAMMHRMLVDETGWVREQDFLDGLNFATLLPGPEAQQLATYLGWRLHGVKGGVIAGAFFVIPGALVMTALGLFYAYGTGLPLVDGLFFGIKAAVLAIVIEALLKIGRRALRTPLLVAVAILSFLALALARLPFPVVIVTAGLAGALVARIAPEWLRLRPPTATESPSPDGRGALRAAAIWFGVWWLPVGAAALLLGGQHLLVEIGLFFSKLAVITFGGAYAVLAYLTEAAVHAKGWVTAPEMLDGLGLAETTPGPTILVNQFVALLAGFRAPVPLTPWLGAVLAGTMAVWVTFAPSYVWIFAGAPFLDRLRASPPVAGALAMITAAVCGVIASLLLTTALAILFGRITPVAWLGLSWPVPDWTSLRPDALILSVIAGLMLFVWHRSVITTVLVMAALGAALTTLR